MEGLSIIIPYHNEGEDFIKTTINQIKYSIDYTPYEIIIVDDLSNKPLELVEDKVTVIRNETNVGVGISFDNGVNKAKYDYLWLMGADIRFEVNHWASLMVNEIKKYPKAITCTTCINYKEGISFKDTHSHDKYYGADILTYVPKGKRILQAQWIRSKKQEDSYSIPCILGAAYGISKYWYKQIDGWWGHRQWGTLEPYISIKSKKFGGDVRIAPQIETGHIFKIPTSNFHSVKLDNVVYNQMLVAILLYDEETTNKLIAYIGESTLKQRALKIIEDNKEEIYKKKEEYLKKIV